MNNEPVAYENTDKEIWRAVPNDYYSPSIFVTKENNIGINVGGSVYVKTVEQWHKNTHPVKELTDEEWNKAFDFYCETDEGVLKFDFELRDEWKKEQLIRWKEALRKASEK